MKNNFAAFRFDPASLARPRKPGISAYMRIKNEAHLAPLAIESHLPFYDEIIACHNGCTDGTEAVLRALAARHPNKIKVFHYAPHVHAIGTAAHAGTPAKSVHSMANYYNYAMAQCSFSHAVKLDADHLAIPATLAPAIKKIRADIAAGKNVLHYFSGINLIERDGQFLACGFPEHVFSGNGDIFYHPVTDKITFTQAQLWERYNIVEKRLFSRQFSGVLYFHLKHLKPNCGTANYGNQLSNIIAHEMNSTTSVALDELLSQGGVRKIIAATLPLKQRLRFHAYSNGKLKKLRDRWIQKLTHVHVIRLWYLLENKPRIALDNATRKQLLAISAAIKTAAKPHGAQ